MKVAAHERGDQKQLDMEAETADSGRRSEITHAQQNRNEGGGLFWTD